MSTNHTKRGFARIEFKDRTGDACSLQKSSLATEDAIWLGCDGNRMHLTQHMAAMLVPILRHFADTGDLLAVEDIPRPHPMDEAADYIAGAIARADPRLASGARQLADMVHILNRHVRIGMVPSVMVVESEEERQRLLASFKPKT